jgi:hypothetical protein
MTPLLPAGPALGHGCTPPAIQSPTALRSPGAPDDPAPPAGPALDLGCTPPAIQSPTTLPSRRSAR